jgi:hypothetical protein
MGRRICVTSICSFTCLDGGTATFFVSKSLILQMLVSVSGGSGTINAVPSGTDWIAGHSDSLGPEIRYLAQNPHASSLSLVDTCSVFAGYPI